MGLETAQATTGDSVLTEERRCLEPKCGKVLHQRSDEGPFMFRKRIYCNQQCAGHANRGKGKGPQEKLVFFGPRRKRGGLRDVSKLCPACGCLPHRVEGAECRKCGLEHGPEPRLMFAGSLLKSGAAMALDYAPWPED